MSVSSEQEFRSRIAPDETSTTHFGFEVSIIWQALEINDMFFETNSANPTVETLSLVKNAR